MKKKVTIAVLSSMLLVGGGNFAYHSYAADSVKESASTSTDTNNDTISIDQEAAELKPESPVGQGTMPDGTINIGDIPAEDIHIPISENQVSRSSGLSLVNTEALQREYGLHIRSSYSTADGNQIRISQTDALKDIPKVIESLKRDYSLETVEITEINGTTALYVDGESRRVVHLITKDHLFTVGSSTATLDELMNIATQIQE